MIQPTLFGSNLRKPAYAVLFCGGGGSSAGMARVYGYGPLVAVNHNTHALRVHALNHPDTIHLQEDVRELVPAVVARGRALDSAWFSPGCQHFSRARGSAPKSDQERSLAWVVIDWARMPRPPRVLFLENVCEFEDWGPLDSDGQPIPERAGETFREWVGQLQGAGYVVEWKTLVAADYGAPTSRKRLYLVARRDGRPIVWSTPTHGPGRALPWRTAAECIDWTIPCPSIFDRDKPLVYATERRIAFGLVRYVLENPRPFLVRYQGDGLVVPHITKMYGQGTGSDVGLPMPTVTAGGGRGNTHLGLVTAWIAKHYGNGVVGHGVQRPLGTVTAVDHHSLCAATLSQTDMAGAQRVAAFIVKYYGKGGQWQGCDSPLGTVVTRDRFGLVTVTLEGEPWVVTDVGLRMFQPRELARAMGFPDSYRLEGTKGEQVARIGNAVCPDVAEALVRANR